MADEFEQAVFYSFAQPGTAPAEVQAAARAALDAARAGPGAWELCLAHLSSSAYPEVRFWCLQSLHGLVRERYEELNPGQRAALRGALLGAALRGEVGSQAFLRNKLAQVLAALAARAFPAEWPGFFTDLASGLTGGEAATGADAFCRVLAAIDEDIISLDVPRSAAGARAAADFKDAMRDGALTDLAAAWTGLLAAALGGGAPNAPGDAGAAAAVLRAVERYVHWIDIGLVVNSQFVPLLFRALSAPEPGVRAAAARLLAAIVGKRMEAQPKLALVGQLGVVPECARWAGGLPGRGGVGGAGAGGHDGTGTAGDDDEDDLAPEYARLLASLAGEILEAMKKIENAVLSMAAVGLAVDEEAGREAAAGTEAAAGMLNALFPALLTALGDEDEEVSGAVVPFLLAYVSWLRAAQRRAAGAGGDPPPAGLRHVPGLLAGLGLAARYPMNSGGATGVSGTAAERRAEEEEEAAMADRRQDLFTLLKNCYKLDPAGAVGYVRGALAAGLASPGAPWQDAELALALLYQLGEPGAEEPALATLACDVLQTGPWTLAHAGGAATAATASQPGSRTPSPPLVPMGTLPGTGVGGTMAGAAPGAPQPPPPPHRLVALGSMECAVRFARALGSPPASDTVLPAVAAAFLGPGGLGSRDDAVARRGAYLFCRLAKALRGQLRPHAGAVLGALAPILTLIAATPAAETPGTKAAPGRATGGVSLTAVDDRMYAFEAAGLLLGLEDLPPAEQAAWLAAIIQPLVSQVEQALEAGENGPPTLTPAGTLATPALLAQQALEGVTRVAKGFSPRLCTELRPRLGAEFGSALAAAARIPARLPRHRPLRARLLSFLHRMVETLGVGAAGPMPDVLWGLVRAGADAGDLAAALTLLVQLVTRFKDGMTPLVAELLPVIVPRVHAELGPEHDWSGAPPPESPAAAAAETARERDELQRAFFMGLLCIATAGQGTQLLAVDGAGLDATLRALCQAAGMHPDAAVRKTAIQTLHRLLAGWLEGGAAQSSPAILSFAIEEFAGQVCLQCMLVGPGRLDARDAACLSLLSEAGAGLAMTRGVAGSRLDTHLANVVFPHLGWPEAAGQQLLALLSTSSTKHIRDFLREALQQPLQANAAKALR